MKEKTTSFITIAQRARKTVHRRGEPKQSRRHGHEYGLVESKENIQAVHEHQSPYRVATHLIRSTTELPEHRVFNVVQMGIGFTPNCHRKLN